MGSAPRFIPPRDDGIEVLLAQHQIIRGRLEAVADEPESGRSAAFELLGSALATHEATEGMLLRPLTRASLVGGELVADARAQEEDQVRRSMRQLSELGVWSETFLTSFRELSIRIVAHLDREETYEFPLVRAYRDEDALAALATVVLL